jgi:dTDP-4-dehydrorhamnose reductase
MKIAVTGALGQLGGELCRKIGGYPNFHGHRRAAMVGENGTVPFIRHNVIPIDIDTLDLTDGNAVKATLLPLRPEIIINCAAYTQVDKAENEPERAHAVNVTAVENLVRVCRELDCPLVQISTDYVFGGERIQTNLNVKPRPLVAPDNHPFHENDPPSPQGIYAQSKLAGERAAAAYEKHLIVRTCGLYARPSDTRAQNFVKTMLRLAATHKELRIVNDQHCTPSYVPHVARAILFLAGVNQSKPALWGIYHVTNTGETTWYDFAAEIFKLAGIDIVLKPITTAEYAAPAPRPFYSVLDTSAYHKLGGPPMPDWKVALEDYFIECNKFSRDP